MKEQINWIIEQHRSTNHLYDNFLPYEFHLRMAVKVAQDNIQLIPEHFRDEVILATWGHDLIEDCRVTYNDVKQQLGELPADIIYSVSNEKGKNRAERACERYYDGIRSVMGGVFVKLCDRIANVQYSKMELPMSKGMIGMYEKENKEFIKKLNVNGYNPKYLPMVNYLNQLFK